MPFALAVDVPFFVNQAGTRVGQNRTLAKWGLRFHTAAVESRSMQTARSSQSRYQQQRRKVCTTLAR